MDPRQESTIWPTVSNAEVHSLVPFDVLDNGVHPTENRSILNYGGREILKEIIYCDCFRLTPTCLREVMS